MLAPCIFFEFLDWFTGLFAFVLLAMVINFGFGFTTLENHSITFVVSHLLHVWLIVITFMVVITFNYG